MFNWKIPQTIDVQKQLKSYNVNKYPKSQIQNFFRFVLDFLLKVRQVSEIQTRMDVRHLIFVRFLNSPDFRYCLKWKQIFGFSDTYLECVQNPNFCSDFRHFCALAQIWTRLFWISDKFGFQASDFRHLLYYYCSFCECCK